MGRTTQVCVGMKLETSIKSKSEESDHNKNGKGILEKEMPAENFTERNSQPCFRTSKMQSLRSWELIAVFPKAEKKMLLQHKKVEGRSI